MTRMAWSELPPSSKKLSWVLMLGWSRTSAKMRAISCSVGVRGGECWWWLVVVWGVGRALRSILPETARGRVSRVIQVEGIM